MKNGEGKTTKSDPPVEEGEMALSEHLYELRGRLIKSIVFVILAFGASLFFFKEMVDFFKQPLVDVLPEAASALHFTSPIEGFTATVKLSFTVAVVCSCPFWLWQLWRFVEPALYPTERKYVKPAALLSMILFITGVVFCYYFVLPLTLEYLIDLGKNFGAPVITVKDYFSMLTTLILGFGLVFETPVVLVLLGVLGVIEVEFLKKNRTYVIVICMVVSAIMTPPDPGSMMMMMVPLYFMYECSILILRFIGRKPRKKAA